MESEILISHKLAEFKETRAIATAVEICDDADYIHESLKELNEEWSEVKYPLIKDGKLKEIFREWGKVVGIDEKTMFTVSHHNCSSTTLFQTDDDALFTIELPGYFGEINGKYTSEQIIGNKE